MRIVGLPRNPDGRSLTSNQRRQARWMNANPFAFKILSARHLAAELGQVRRRCLMCCRHFIPAFVQESLMDHCACVCNYLKLFLWVRASPTKAAACAKFGCAQKD